MDSDAGFSAGFWFGLLLVNIFVFVIPAGIIGQNKGQGGNCACLAFFFGPLGLLIGMLLPDLKKREEERLQHQEQQYLLKKQIALQEETLRLSSGRLSGNIPPPPGSSPRPQKTFKIAKDGQEFGDLDLTEICDLINSNDLSLTDYYFDTASNTWVMLDQHPQLAKG